MHFLFLKKKSNRKMTTDAAYDDEDITLLKLLRDRDESKKILSLALPCVVTNVLIQAMAVVDQVFVGSLGKEELAAAALSSTYFNLFFLFLFGFCTALDTLSSQSFGAGDLDGGVPVFSLFSMSIFAD
jgi:Na+-driven multidrug efflux pump